MKTILLLVHDDAGQEARFQAALDVARGLEGHLTCVGVAQLPTVIGDFYSTAGEMMLLDEEQARERRNRATLEDRLSREDVPWDWVERTGDISECITRAAELADLIVVNRKLDAEPTPDMHGITGRITVRAAKPVLAVPDTLRRFETAGRALIAWDGSEPVAATMRACVPLLKLASAVDLLTVDDGSEQCPAEDAATYLSRHDITATVHRVPGGKRRADAVILEMGVALEADYYLMGAFSHARLTQALFGGVTHRMLANSPLPLILGQ
jgi:nucleotide-binding universal stress UspA family protein